jgi:hypothetical protein
LSRALITTEHDVSETEAASIFREGKRHLIQLLRANLNRPVIEVRVSGGRRVEVSLPSHEDGNRSGFRNVVFSSYLEFRTMDRVQNLSNSDCNTLASELFRIVYESLAVLWDISYRRKQH